MNKFFSLVLLANFGTASSLPNGTHSFARFLNDVQNCDHDELNNAGGAHRCSGDDNQCTGNRECSPWGWCSGNSDCHKPDLCNIDETANAHGAHRCDNDD